jgi:hypothetical protein
MNRKSKIPDATKQELLEHYLLRGYAESTKRCAGLGLSPKYAANLAAAMGIHRHKNNGTRTSTRSADDPRWARAVAVGAVVA